MYWIISTGKALLEVHLANKTEYGLSSYIWGNDEAECQSVGRKIRAGMVLLMVHLLMPQRHLADIKCLVMAVIGALMVLKSFLK